MAKPTRDDNASRDAEARRFGEERGLPEEIIHDLQRFLRQAGEATDPRYNIPAHLKYTVFPIIALRRTDDRPSGAVAGDPKVQGTAVMLSHDGLFLTAGHCVNVAFGEKDITGQNAHDPSDYAIIAVEFSQRAFKFCQVLDLSICPTCDVAVGRAELPGSDYPDILGLATARLGNWSAVLGIGYPDSQVDGEPGGALKMSLFARCYTGKIEEWQRDLVPWNGPRSPGYRHSVTTPPGFSGGPLIRKRTGLVHGLMAGGFNSFGGPSVALDVGAFVSTWKVPMLGDLTLREYASKNPRQIVAR